jgi:hypothetical protein
MHTKLASTSYSRVCIESRVSNRVWIVLVVDQLVPELAYK